MYCSIIIINKKFTNGLLNILIPTITTLNSQQNKKTTINIHIEIYIIYSHIYVHRNIVNFYLLLIIFIIEKIRHRKNQNVKQRSIFLHFALRSK